MKKIIGYAAHIASCLALAACGGGGGGSGSSSTASIASLSGTVVDGYIEGATVCLDLNSNQACDVSEPSAITNASGAYTLNTASLTVAQVRAAHILVVVPSTAKDLDDGGQTLTQAGKKPFWLLAPTSAYVTSGGNVSGSAVVSPFTTLVSHAMLTNPGTALDEAQGVIRTQLSLSSSIDLLQNFVSTPNASLQGKARTIAYLIGKVSDGATSVGGATTRDRLLAALQYARTRAAVVQSVVDADASNSSIPTKVDTAIATTGLVPDYSNLVAEAQSLTSVTTSTFANVLSTGVYVETCLLNPSCSTFLYGKLTGQSGQATLDYYANSSNTWVTYSPNPTIRKLGNGSWDAVQFGNPITYTSVDSNTLDVTGPWGGRTSRGTLTQFDLSGKSSTDIPGSWSKTNTYLKPISFPNGSMVYISRSAPTADQYTLWNDYPNTCGPSGACSQNSGYTSVVSLIADHQTTGATNTTKHLSWSDVIVTFDGYGTSGTATLWADATRSCVRIVDGYSCAGSTPSYTKIGSTTYEVKTVSGVDILVIAAQSSVDEAGYPIYSARGGAVYRGIFVPKGHPNNTALYFNTTAANAILAAWSKPAVLN